MPKKYRDIPPGDVSRFLQACEEEAVITGRPVGLVMFYKPGVGWRFTAGFGEGETRRMLEGERFLKDQYAR